MITRARMVYAIEGSESAPPRSAVREKKLSGKNRGRISTATEKNDREADRQRKTGRKKPRSQGHVKCSRSSRPKNSIESAEGSGRSRGNRE